MEPTEAHKYQKWCNDKGTRIYPVPLSEKGNSYRICVEREGVPPTVGKLVFENEATKDKKSIWDQIREIYKIIYKRENMELTGITVRVLETKTTGTNEYKTRSIHLKTEEQYPQTLEIQFSQGNVSLLDGIEPGKRVKITVNIEGREWTNPQGEIVVFNTIKGWKIEKLNQ